MKTLASNHNNNLTANFDAELLSVLKDDLCQQNRKLKAKFIHLATHTFDSELLNILKTDLNKFSANTFGNTFARAI